MIYKVFRPAPALADVVEHYWYCRIDQDLSEQRFFATPLLQGLAFNFRRLVEQHVFKGNTQILDKQVYLFGQPVCPHLVTNDVRGVEVLGVKFKTLGISKITGVNMDYLADRITAAEEIWGNEIESLCDEMQSAPTLADSISVLERFLSQKTAQTELHYRIYDVAHAVKLIKEHDGNIRIKELQSLTHTSRKTLERAFLTYLGIHPKLYSRIVRFNSIKKHLDRGIDPDYTSLALDGGFYDSSHFVSEFKTFAGVTPGVYLHSLRGGNPRSLTDLYSES